MQFFLCEIVARIVAAYLCVNCYRKLRNGLAERKIAYVSADLLDWWTHGVADRDAAPVSYWIQMGSQTTTLAACAVVTIFGWWQPTI
jgi:hypothetical protein